MLDFIKEETSQKTMTANVILTFDTLINEFGTQEIFDVEFAIADTGDETVFNMLSAINNHIDCRNLPKKELWKISTAANWSKVANEYDLNIQIINDTNGKWQFGWKESMTEDEQFLEEEFGFGQNVYFTNESVEQRSKRIYEQMIALQSNEKLDCGYELSCELADAENKSSELSSTELCKLKIQILNKYTQDAFDEYCDAYKEQFSKLPLSIEDYQRLQRFYFKNNKSS
jgi:hypothetical protein